MTGNGVVHLAFHPSPDHILLACGDKDGRVSLWSVDQDPDPLTLTEAAAAREGEGGPSEGGGSEDLDSASGEGNEPSKKASRAVR